MGSVLLNTADSNPRDPVPPSDPVPPVLSLEPPAFAAPKSPPTSPQPPPDSDRSVAIPPGPPTPAAPSPDPPTPPTAQRSAATSLRCTLVQWQRAGQTQGLTVALFCLDLVLILFVAGPGPWSSAQCGRWHATAGFLLCLPLLPEAIARCISHSLPLPSSARPDAGSFPSLASALSSQLARVLYAVFEGYDLVILFFCIILLPSLSAHSLHPRLSGGGTAFAVFRALRILRLLPVIAETWLCREESANAAVEMSVEHGQK
eukprot:2525907-Rhodomonas_salina.1